MVQLLVLSKSYFLWQGEFIFGEYKKYAQWNSYSDYFVVMKEGME